MHALHGRHGFDKLADFSGKDGPAVADVTNEFEAFVLSEDEDTPEA